MRKLMGLIAALIMTLSGGMAVAQEQQGQAANAADSLTSHAQAVVRAQQSIEAAIRDNKTELVEKHASEALAASKRVKQGAAVLPEPKRQQVFQAATVAEQAASRLVEIGKQNTIAENGMLVMQFGEQAKALLAAVSPRAAQAAGQGQPGAAAAQQAQQQPKPLGNTLCPIGGSPVGSMQAGSGVVHDGYFVGLCCNGCRGQFAQDPDGYLEKARQSVPQ